MVNIKSNEHITATQTRSSRIILPKFRQGQVGSHSGYWAWGVSIAVHLIVLAAFGAAKFSRFTPAGNQLAAPMAQVTQIKKLIHANPIIPKPKVKKPIETILTHKTAPLVSAGRILGTTRPNSEGVGKFVRSSVPASKLLVPDSRLLPRGIEFFGSWTDQRKVCYVVDCSGSMKGIFGQVQKKLKDSVESLQPDQYFCIIFYGNNKISEFGDGRLVRATGKAKSAAYDFVDSVRPAGSTNTMAALQRAVQIHDARGSSPSVIYFLTDGFELVSEDSHKFSKEIARLLKRFAPTTKINTIGFWPQSQDRKLLETIARQTGGEFVFVGDDNN